MVLVAATSLVTNGTDAGNNDCDANMVQVGCANNCGNGCEYQCSGLSYDCTDSCQIDVCYMHFVLRILTNKRRNL